MTSIGAPGRAKPALLSLVLVVAACGGTSPTEAPTAAPRTFAPTSAPTPEPTPAPTAVVTPEASKPPVDPADDLEIAAPYELELLNAAFADALISAMKSAMGPLEDIVEVGIRTATRGGEDAAILIVMDLPGVPMGTAILDGAAAGAAGEAGGEVETLEIAGAPARHLVSGGFDVIMTIVDDEIVMVMAPDREGAVDAATAIITANP